MILSSKRDAIRGLYAIADVMDGADPTARVAQLLTGGCRLLQIRCKGWSESDVEDVVRRVLPATRAVGALLIVNDWPGVARRTGADGVHVGQSDMDARTVRQIVGKACLIGVSHNTPAQLSSSLEVADYVAVGPVFPTSHLSEPKPVRGLDWVRTARSMTSLPLVGIGGITAERIPEVRAAGADAWAVIGAISHAPDPVAATRALVNAS